MLGPTLILFARHIDMPPRLVGFLVAFMPLSMVLIVFTVPLVERFGPRRLMMTMWTLRNLAACGAFALPWVLAYSSPAYAWAALCVSVLAFCVMRSLGVGGWFPWLHEMLDENQRGSFFSAEAAIAQVVIVLVNLLHALVLFGDPGLYHFLLLYGVGVAAGLGSVGLMARIPGGTRTPDHERSDSSLALYRQVFANRVFLRVLLFNGAGYIALMALKTASVLYLRDEMQYSENLIMAIFTGGSITVFFTVRSWSQYAEQQGITHGAALTLLGHAVACGAFLFAVPGAAWALPVVIAAMLIALVLQTAFQVITEHGLLNYIEPAAKVAYTNTWMFTTALAMGTTPIAVGFLIDFGGSAAYTIIFTVAGVLSLLAAIFGPVFLPGAERRNEALVSLINPALTLRSLGRIAWVTAGLDPNARRSG